MLGEDEGELDTDVDGDELTDEDALEETELEALEDGDVDGEELGLFQSAFANSNVVIAHT